MLDSVLRRHLDGVLAPVTAQAARLRIGADRLTLAAFASGAVAVFDISRRYYLFGLGFLAVARMFDVLDGPVARLNNATVFGAYMEQILDLLIGGGVAFAFALAQPDRALAAMFLMLGLLVRTSAAAGAFPPVRSSPSIVYFNRVGVLVEKTDLFVAFALACIFPDWFSVIAYIVGILCFIAAGGRAAAAASQRP